MNNETLYWILGIVGFIILGMTWLVCIAVGYMAGKKWGCVPCRDLQNGKTVFVQVDSLKDASTVGFKLVRRHYGPGGILSEWITIPEPFLVKDSDGKVEKLYMPRDLYIKQVTGFCQVEAGQLAIAEMFGAEYFTRWQEERVRNVSDIDAQADKHIKRLGEAVPYTGLNRPKRPMGGGSNAYNRQ